MKKIYFDMDETILTESNSGHVRVHKMAQQMIGICVVMGYECHLLTTSIRSRAIELIDKYYPNTFKTITAREDFTEYRNTGYAGSDWYASKRDVDPTSLLVDNDFHGNSYHCGISARLKMDYLGVGKDRCFPYNNFESKLPMMFEKFIKELK